MKLRQLRKLMNKLGIAAYLVPKTNPHISEYIPPSDERYAFRAFYNCYCGFGNFEIFVGWTIKFRLEFISGFTGSAGYAVVTLEHALLWTDGRYWKQAEKELNLKPHNSFLVINNKAKER